MPTTRPYTFELAEPDNAWPCDELPSFAEGDQRPRNPLEFLMSGALASAFSEPGHVVRTARSAKACEA